MQALCGASFSSGGASAPQSSRPTHTRHLVLWLTVAAYMITYMDRVVIGSAVPSIRREFGFDIVTMGWILAAFRWGYTLFQIPGGWMGDRLGPRRALSLIVTWWSLFTCLTGAAWGAISMATIRFLFGVGEAGAFPIATRSLSRWMLPSERGYSQGVTHAGSRLGAALTPPIVVALIASYGWRVPFYTFGVLGMLWTAVWFFWYRDVPAEHPGVNAAELELINASIGATRTSRTVHVPWRRILSHPTLWYLLAMYSCYAFCIAVYLEWFPTYLSEHRHVTLKQMGWFASLPLLAGTAGDLLGGWLSDRILKRTGDLRFARRSVAIAGFLLGALAIIPAALTRNPIACVAFSCIAVFGMELTVGVAWAIPLDIGGDYAGSVSSIMNCGNIGGAISPALAAYLIQWFGWEMPFLVASGLCMIAALLFFKIDASSAIGAESV
mgnify:CR=1 FL=1